MSYEALFTLGVAAAALVFFVTEAWRMDKVAIAVPLALLAGGVIDLPTAASGLSNSATLTVAAMLVLGLALQKAGIVEHLARTAKSVTLGGPTLRLALLCAIVAAISPFLSNTAVVVVFLPIFLALAVSSGQSPSRVLMPLSFSAILGGTVTIIGTSTNVIVHNVARNRGLDELSIFSIAPLGLVYLAVGLLYLFTIGRRLLPDRPAAGILGDEVSSRHFTTELRVTERSRSLHREFDGEAWIRRYGLDSATPLRSWYALRGPATLAAGDLIAVSGSAAAIFDCAHREALSTPRLAKDTPADSNTSVGEELPIIELMVAPGSRLIGRTLRELRFGSRYSASVLAVQRPRRPLSGRLAQQRFLPGDLLLVQGEPKALSALVRDSGFTPIGEVPGHAAKPPALVAGAVLLGVVIVSATGWVDLATAAFCGAILAVLLGCIRLSEIYRELDWAVIALLAGLLPLGVALDQSGAASSIGELLAHLLGNAGPTVAVLCFYLVTSLLTEVMSNQAAAVVLTPIAISTAASLGLSPYALIVAVMFGASASFMTPIGYQTNTLVYGPGGYRFSDYIRVGGPLNAILAVVAAFLIPRMF